MSAVTEILTADQLHDLWGAGFTIVQRPVDPFEIDPKLIPRGMSYQWNPIDLLRDPGQCRPDGWTAVPYSRHEGVFAPWGTPGNIEVGGLQLCEKTKAEVEHNLERTRARSEQLVQDWATKAATEGITGSVRVGTQSVEGKLDTLNQLDIGAAAGMEPIKDFVEIPRTRTIETTVGVPPEMSPHLKAIFEERDRLEADVVRKNRTLKPGPIADKFYAAVEADKGAPWWPTLRAILLPIAVDNVRAALKKEKTDD